MKKNIALFSMILIIILSLALSSCTTITDIFAEKPIEVETTISDIQYEDFSMAGVKIAYNLTLKNLSSAKVTVTSYDYKIMFKNNFEYTGSHSDELSIEGNSQTIISIVKELNFFELAKAVSDFKERDTLEVILDGTMHLKNSTETKDITFNATQNLRIPQLPKFTMGKVKIEKMDFTYVILGFNVTIDNPNPFDMEFTPSYALKFNTDEVVKVSNDTKLIVEKESISEKTIEVQVNLLSLSTRILDGKDVNITFDGALEYESFLGGTEQALILKDDFALAILPEMSIKNISIETKSVPPSATLYLILDVYNKNDFKIEIVDWSCSLKLNKVSLVKSYSIDPISIQSNTKQNIKVPIKLDPTKLASSGLSGDFLVDLKLTLKSLIGEDNTELSFQLGF